MSGGLAVRTGLTFVLVGMKNINVFGVVIANTVFLAISAVFCVVFIKKHLYVYYNPDKGFVRPAICTLLTGLVMVGVKMMLKPHLVSWVYIGICGVVCVFVYLALIFLFRVFTRYELKFLPNKKIFKKFKE